MTCHNIREIFRQNSNQESYTNDKNKAQTRNCSKGIVLNEKIYQVTHRMVLYLLSFLEFLEVAG